jgi:hypothetical protein
MTTSEHETPLAIGKLMLEQSALEKQIAKLRDQLSLRARTFAQIGKILLFHPERLVFEGQTVDAPFAAEGESPVDRTALEVDSLIADLRTAIARKNSCAVELAEFGIDPEQTALEQNQRDSRALFHLANVRYGPETETKGTKRDNLGFTRPRKKASDD